MSKYNKLIGALIGGVVGILLNWLGLSETIDVPLAYQPLVDSLVTLITAAIGTYFAPKNAPS
jgi:hypothetical protein